MRRMAKVTVLTGVVLTAVILFLANPVSAWDPPSTYVEGSAQIEAIRSHGNESVGGIAYGNASGSFQAWGEDYAEGEAGATGMLKGYSASDSSTAFSKSKAAVNSYSYGGGEYSEISVSGTASQANWGAVDRGDAGFIAGGNITEGGYEGYAAGAYPYLEGGALAKGFTNLQATGTSTHGVTAGKAEAWLVGDCGDPWVSGEGYLAGGNAVNQSNVGAVATISGGANFNAAGPNYAAGALKVEGATNINVSSGAVNIDSAVRARSYATRE